MGPDGIDGFDGIDTPELFRASEAHHHVTDPVRPRRARRGSRWLLIAAGAMVMTLSALTPAGASERCGTYSYGFHGTRLINDGISTQAGPYSIDLPAGTYTVTLTSHDNHDEQGPVPTQPGESYYVVLDSGYVTPPSTDIPDAETNMTTVFTNQVVPASTTITVRHPGGVTPNSVNVLCVGFTPVAAGADTDDSGGDDPSSGADDPTATPETPADDDPAKDPVPDDELEDTGEDADPAEDPVADDEGADGEDPDTGVDTDPDEDPVADDEVEDTEQDIAEPVTIVRDPGNTADPDPDADDGAVPPPADEPPADEVEPPAAETPDDEIVPEVRGAVEEPGDNVAIAGPVAQLAITGPSTSSILFVVGLMMVLMGSALVARERQLS